MHNNFINSQNKNDENFYIVSQKPYLVKLAQQKNVSTYNHIFNMKVTNINNMKQQTVNDWDGN